MLKVKVIQADKKLPVPNLALLQIAGAHKSRGNEVGFDVEDPDLVYISCIFRKNAIHARGIAKYYPRSQVSMGGSGLNYDWLPASMQFAKPDYDLYPSEYSQGFTTRGCIRKCPFCIVPHKEPKFRKWQHPKDFHDDRFDTIMIMDNNWLANQKWFFETSDWIIDHGLKVREGGMDIRLLNDKILDQLIKMRFPKGIKFAFDSMDDENGVRRGIKLLEKFGFDLKHEIRFYVLCGYNTTEKEDLYRVNLLRELGVKAFVMKYGAGPHSPFLNRLALWANKAQIFSSTEFKDYTRKDERKNRREKNAPKKNKSISSYDDQGDGCGPA